MSESTKQQYDLYLNTLETGLLKVAQVVLLEEGGSLSRFGYRYTDEYLMHPNAFSLDPVQLPLSKQEFSLPCLGGIPSILDDYLPDDWGRKVLARLAFYRDGEKLNGNSCIDTLSLLSSSRIGALQWVLPGNSPDYGFGGEISQISMAEQAAQMVDQPGDYSEDIDKLSLLFLANAGTSVGGARPKALISDEDNVYLAKFNRLNHDDYNNARVELACLLMAQAAGLEVSLGRVETGINDREVLLLNRFDVVKKNGQFFRRHLITANALLKEPASQRDRGGSFRYDDLAQLIRLYCVDAKNDLEQLLRMMLFNRAINNLDTHERNFSFINIDGCYRLSPAYDMVPSLVNGAYPVAGFQYSPVPPLPCEVANHGKIFGLPKTDVKQIAEEVAEAIKNWRQWSEQAGVSEEDSEKVLRVLKA